MSVTLQSKRDQIASLLKAKNAGAGGTQCIHEMFERWADRAPDCLVLVSDQTQISYGSLECRANQLAHYLRNLGIGPDARIGIYLNRGPEIILALLGVLKAGAAYVPLDPALPDSRIGGLIDDIQAPVIITAGSLSGQLPSGWAHVVSLDTDWPEIALEKSSRPPAIAKPANLAYILHTSGSTGAPKGVGVEHRNLVNYVSGVAERLKLGRDVYAMVSTFGADLGNTVLFGALCSGGTLHVVESDLARDARKLGGYFERHGVDVVKITPTHLAMLLGSSRDASLVPLKTLVLGGEASDAAWVASVQHLRPQCRIWNHYGPTETTVGVLAQPLSDTEGLDTIALGRPLAGTQAYPLDGSMEPVPTGLAGELYIGGASVTRGYHQRPSLTAERFGPDPFGSRPGARLYRTGDLVRWLPDGTLEFLGRADDQIKLRGFRIEPGEIETAILEQRGMRQARVILREDVPGEAKLVAYVVAEPVDFDAAHLRAALAAKLPDQMVPSALVRLDALPLTTNGKLDRKALPKPELPGFSALGDLPRTAIEEILAGIWAEVLHVEQVGRHANFFELGGHSLLATQTISRIRGSFSIDFPLQAMFDQKTLAGLAAEVERVLQEECSSARPPLVSVTGDGKIWPVSFAQQHLWLLDQLSPGGAGYIRPAAVRLTGPLDVAALTQALSAVVLRHEVLRTNFLVENGEPVQIISATAPVSMPLTDLSALPEADRESEALNLAQSEAQRPFNLARDALIRAQLLRLSGEEHIFLLTMHHIISDGWSIGILVEELATLYGALSARQPSDTSLASVLEGLLPELPIQYADFAVWQREWLTDDVLGAEREYWKRTLAGAPEQTDLPNDDSSATGRSGEGATRDVLVPHGTIEALKAACRHNDATLFAGLLAGLSATLFRWTGQGDLVVGTVSANRNRREIEPLIGCFMNFLPLRVTLSNDMTGEELLRRARFSVMEAFTHQDFPFEKIVEAVNPERSTQRNPIYNVGLLLQNFAEPRKFSSALRAEHIEQGGQSALLDLRFVAIETDVGMRLACEYDTGLFDPETVDLLLESFARILARLAAHPDDTLSALPIEDGLAEQAAAARERTRRRTLVVAATFTADSIEQALSYWMQTLGIPARVEFAPYNQVFQELLDPASLTAVNDYGVNVLLIRLEDWPDTERNVEDFVPALESAAARSRVPYVVCLCPSSPQAMTENNSLLTRLEARLAAGLSDISGVVVVTPTELQRLYPVADYSDPNADQLGHIPYRPAFYVALGTLVARKIYALSRPPFKVIVLDCDQTLWGGICGEDGPSGIVLDAPRKALQEFMVARQESGMLLCLCSKNEEQDVWDVFAQRSEMPLKSGHLVSWRINWEPKPDNLRALAEELDLGLDSFIFVDDNPVECAQVQAECPEVLTLELPQEPEQIPKFLEHIWEFDQLKTTVEDGARTSMYRDGLERKRFLEAEPSLVDFLSGLQMQVDIKSLTSTQIPRVSQLTERTNQFNMTARRRSEPEIRGFCGKPGNEGLTVSVRDRFGDYGLVGVLLFRCEPDTLTMDTFLLSCRALGRGVEHRMLARLGERALELGLDVVEIPFVPTAKNAPALNFLLSIAVESERTNGQVRIFRVAAAQAAATSYLTERGPKPKDGNLALSLS